MAAADTAPGYRWPHLSDNGGPRTGVGRISETH